jgi:hypothetical protein|tara:strand:+ start:1640 stop:1864 length:225 start_codon:yes stop_codon:yes gene_type:complete
MNEVKEFILGFVISVPCFFALHRWKYWTEDRTASDRHHKIDIKLLNRRCKSCSKHQWRDQLPPFSYEHEHWHNL